MEKGDGRKTCQKIMKIINAKVLDLYIIKKFLGTYVLALTLIMGIAVIFDFSEKIDDISNGNDDGAIPSIDKFSLASILFLICLNSLDLMNFF